jgi:hypothetical protein
MAFHPFKHFRKYQKVYLVIVTILTMIIFVAQFGAGDPFTRLQQWIGMSVHRGERVIELYGKTIYTDDLTKVRWKRQLASDFLIANWLAVNGYPTPLDQRWQELQKRFGPKQQEPKDVSASSPLQQTVQDVGLALSLSRNPEFRYWLHKSMENVLKQMSFPEAQNNETQYRALDAMATILSFQSWLTDPNHQRNESYFGGTDRTEDLLDFLVWKHEADRLGIVLTQADVCREVNRAWGNDDFLQPNEKFERNKWVIQFFKNSSNIPKNMNEKDLLQALIDEFRVALAKQAVLGFSPGVRSYREAVDNVHFSPSVATPDEFYKYFREQRTMLSVQMLPINVEDFVAEAKKQFQPTEADLRNLFERYKNDEPSPARRQPGFKEPRRIAVEYVSYRPDGPFAQRLAAKTIELLPVFRVGQPAALFAAGGAAAWAASFAGYGDLDTALRVEYNQYRDSEKQRRPVKYDRDDGGIAGRFGLALDFQNRRSIERVTAAATVGQLLGNAASGGTPLAAPVSWEAGEAAYERAAATAVASTVLASASSSPLAAMVLPQRYLYATQPFENVREQMLSRFQDALATRLMNARILKMRRELDKVLGRSSEQKRKEFLDKAIAEDGLEDHHVMSKAQTREEILDHPDNELRELQTEYDATPSSSRVSFVDWLFQPTPINPPPGEPAQSWEFASRSGRAVWLAWRIEDKKAHVRSFAEVKPEVEKAWYLEQARKLARLKAQQINDELKQQHIVDAKAVKQFLIQQKLGRPFELTRVSLLVAPPVNLAPGQTTLPTYTPYQPPKDEVPYPPADLVDRLLKLKQRGDATVIADQPVRHYYVAVLMEDPTPPERSEFYRVYNLLNQPKRDESNPFAKPPEPPLWVRMMEQRQRKFARQIMEQLRAEATKELEDDGVYKLPESLRNRGPSSDSGE